MKKIGIGQMRTFATVQTNIPKIQYGSGKVGAGFVDTYSTLKTIRGLFEPFTGRRVTAAGVVSFVQMYRYTTRFDLIISNNINKQMRMIINGKVYTIDNFKYQEENKQTVIVFTLNLFTK